MRIVQLFEDPTGGLDFIIIENYTPVEHGYVPEAQENLMYLIDDAWKNGMSDWEQRADITGNSLHDYYPGTQVEITVGLYVATIYDPKNNYKLIVDYDGKSIVFFINNCSEKLKSIMCHNQKRSKKINLKILKNIRRKNET